MKLWKISQYLTFIAQKVSSTQENLFKLIPKRRRRKQKKYVLNSLHYDGWLQSLKQCLFLSLAHSAWVQFEVFVCVYLTTCTCNIVLYMNISVNKEKWREQRNKKSLLSELYEVITIWSYLLLQSKKGKLFRFFIFQRVHIEFSHQMLSLVATRKGKHNEYLLAHTYTPWSNRKKTSPPLSSFVYLRAIWCYHGIHMIDPLSVISLIAFPHQKRMKWIIHPLAVISV